MLVGIGQQDRESRHDAIGDDMWRSSADRVVGGISNVRLGAGASDRDQRAPLLACPRRNLARRLFENLWRQVEISGRSADRQKQMRPGQSGEPGGFASLGCGGLRKRLIAIGRTSTLGRAGTGYCGVVMTRSNKSGSLRGLPELYQFRRAAALALIQRATGTLRRPMAITRSGQGGRN